MTFEIKVGSTACLVAFDPDKITSDNINMFIMELKNEMLSKGAVGKRVCIVSAKPSWQTSAVVCAIGGLFSIVAMASGKNAIVVSTMVPEFRQGDVIQIPSDLLST